MEQLGRSLVQFDPGDAAAEPPPGRRQEPRPGCLIIIERRAFVRELLGLWIGSLQPGFDVVSAAYAERSVPLSVLAQASLVIFGVNAPALPDPWLDQQIGWIRANRADVPLVSIADGDDGAIVCSRSVGTRLQGCIPTSSSMSLAAAALLLVAAGGIYFPQAGDEDGAPRQAPLNQGRQLSTPTLVAKLTPRERAVLEFLEQGMANKIIAYRLGLSQSTVKAHVHSIISKLKVRNRTEAAITSHRLA